MPQLSPPKHIEAVNPDGSLSKQMVSFHNTIVTKLNNADAVPPVATPNPSVAPGAYSQAHVQSIVDQLNATKAQLNALVAALNT